MQALLITSCNDSLKWYSKLVGSIVDLLAVEEIEYKSLEPAGYVNFISKEDAKIVDLCDDCGTVLLTDLERTKKNCDSCRTSKLGV